MRICRTSALFMGTSRGNAALRKIAQRIAFFQQTLEKIGPYATASFRQMLSEALTTRIHEFGIDLLVKEESACLDELTTRSESAIVALVEDYLIRVHPGVDPD